MVWNKIVEWDVTAELGDNWWCAWAYGANRQAHKIVVTLWGETQEQKLDRHYNLKWIGHEPQRNPHNHISLQSVQISEQGNETLVEVLSKTQENPPKERKFLFRFTKKGV